MRIIVCGSRDFNDLQSFKLVLDEYKSYDLHIVHGGAKGADVMAGAYAKAINIACTVFPAQWKKDGKKAGFLRNQRMLAESKPDLVLAFYSNIEQKSKGTAHMVRIAQEAGVAVREM